MQLSKSGTVEAVTNLTSHCSAISEVQQFLSRSLVYPFILSFVYKSQCATARAHAAFLAASLSENSSYYTLILYKCRQLI